MKKIILLSILAFPTSVLSDAIDGDAAKDIVSQGEVMSGHWDVWEQATILTVIYEKKLWECEIFQRNGEVVCATSKADLAKYKYGSK